MNLKNKILLTLIAIIFAICLFNTNCFASASLTYNNTEYTLDIPFNYYFVGVNKNANSFVVFGSDETFTIKYDDYYETHIALKSGNADIYYQCTTFSGSSSFADVSKYKVNASGGLTVPIKSYLYSNFDLYDNTGKLLIEGTIDKEERGTEGDNTNPDSGETGNETVGGDIETDTDSDDSGGILSSITQGFKNVIDFFTQLVEFVGNILSYLNPFSDNFILKVVIDFLGEILSYINPFSENFFVYKLIELLGDLLEFLFIPNENSFTGIIDIVKSKFDFIDTIKISANSLKDLISNVGTAPKLTINVNNNKYGVEQVTLIDLEWYKPYKTYGDLVLTGFIYVFFLWRLFISIPNILHGFGGSVQDSYKISEIKGGKN